VRFSEVGPRRTTSLETLSCLLQEAACNHVLTIGYGAFHGMNDERLITVTTRMHIEVDRYPAWRSLLEIDTWFCTEGRNAVRRDWTVKEVRTGEVIACATSIWVLMHVDTKTMHRVTDKIRAELAPWVRDPPKLVSLS
jgi:acyl-ACP thioesterase